MMKKITTLFSLSILWIFLINNTTANSQNRIEKVIAEKTFPVNTSSKLIINHEHGNVYCNNWDKNEISIKLTAITNTENEKKAENAFDKISWEIEGNSNEIFVRCKLSGKDIENKNIVSVDMEINMPKSVNINLSHKFGKALVEQVDGPAIISSEYGSVKINSLTNAKSKFKIAYGEGHINEFAGSSFIIQYSKISFEKASDVSIKSEYSEIDGAEIGNRREPVTTDGHLVAGDALGNRAGHGNDRRDAQATLEQAAFRAAIGPAIAARSECSLFGRVAVIRLEDDQRLLSQA